MNGFERFVLFCLFVFLNDIINQFAYRNELSQNLFKLSCVKKKQKETNFQDIANNTHPTSPSADICCVVAFVQMTVEIVPEYHGLSKAAELSGLKVLQ